MPPKREPIVSTGNCSTAHNSVSVTSATIGPGMRAAVRSVRPSSIGDGSGDFTPNSHGHANSPTTHTAPIANAYGLKVSMCAPKA